MDIISNREARKYSNKEMVLRILWSYIGTILFRMSFRTMFKWRNLILSLFGAKIGKNVHIYNTASIYFPWNLDIGDYSAIGESTQIYNLGKVTIGQHVTISQNSHLCAGSHDYHTSAMTLTKLPIKIEDNVWVCTDSFIGPNTNIKKNSIIGARSAVFKNVPPNQIWGGNPAKYLKDRK
ncbi:WcaF family extracellular polysaccharide biosynthesis acetyltransferase [Lentisphaera marina]|uniref:WcaF family extracellular polysaccharide biosynthesis acetyltransferase n=1 Tax=Lentisphaera marina TaxID=1111041 RepID=UPI0023652BFA|nr:WcaF family extracellular polysaccharide biosynthesis acetyltransferase [Lentisphaera marina]MDD7986905.1 WcaF family extracellular polysaccharide biosynthesis acetyltransferase [Lentisphaera marina]